MKVQYYTATTLDGFIADPEHSLSWLFQFEDPQDTSYPSFIADVGAIVMGSSTYEWLLRNHIYAEATPKPWMYEQPAWVFSSRQLQRIEAANITFANGDVSEVFPAIREAAAGRNVWVVGGGDLAGQFHDRGLLDEIIVQIAPVTLGRGAPLFPRRLDVPPLKLSSVQPYQSGMIEARYLVQRKS